MHLLVFRLESKTATEDAILRIESGEIVKAVLSVAFLIIGTTDTLRG
jgi:hypothetical protein